MTSLQQPASGVEGLPPDQRAVLEMVLGRGHSYDEIARLLKIDRELVDAAPWVPLYNPRDLTVLSARTGNYQFHPYWNLLIDQLWVR